jgi:hypothetical protein
MINTRYRKLTGMHANHVYKAIEPASEVDRPLCWVLHCETVKDETLIASEDELSDPKRWQPLD